MSSVVVSRGVVGSLHRWADSTAQSPLIAPNAWAPGLDRRDEDGPFPLHIGRMTWSGLSFSNSVSGYRSVARHSAVVPSWSWSFRQREFHGFFQPMKHNLRRRSESRAGFSKSLSVTASSAELSSMPIGETEDGTRAGSEEIDAFYMRMAVELARMAVGHTSPNPMVGCVLVKDGKIVGKGFHPKAGEPHAEVFALREAGENARGATAYVSLEPCNHTGRTPPCSQALVRAEVKRVVVGTVDPNPLVGGQGVQTLQNAGIEVLVGVEEELCKATAESFFHRIVTKKPFLTVRYMLALDGTLLRDLDYGGKAGQDSSLLLQENDAVVITSSCLQKGDPVLLSEEPGARQPLRVVLASSISDLPLDRRVFDTTLAPTVVFIDERDSCNDEKSSRAASELALRSKHVEVVVVDDLKLDSVLDVLYQRGFTCVLMDFRGTELLGVHTRLGSLAVVQRAAQKVVVVISPVLTGDKPSELDSFAHDEPQKLQRVSTKMDSGHVIIEGYLPSGTNA